MNEPKIRFKGFEGEWEKVKFSDILLVNSGKDYKFLENGNVPVYGTGGYMLSVNKSLSDCDAIGIGRKGTINKPQYLHAPFWTVDTLFFLTPIKEDNLTFLYSFAQIINWEKYDESTGVPSLSKTNIDKIEILMPGKAEQQAIASYFTHLDTLITTSTSRLASLKQMKAASLQAMFPQEGETVPKIRFKGFEGEWEKVKFEEAFGFLKNNSLSRAELSDQGIVMNVHYGDVLIKYPDCLDVEKEEVTFVKDSSLANKLYGACPLQKGDVIFADAAEDNTVGKCTELVNCDGPIVSGLHTIPVRPLRNYASRYLGYYLNSPSYHNQLLVHIQGSKISSISKRALAQTLAVAPKTVAEQRAIASYFTSLDKQITLLSQRLEKLKQIKSACLDKMFV